MIYAIVTASFFLPFASTARPDGEERQELAADDLTDSLLDVSYLFTVLPADDAVMPFGTRCSHVSV